MKAEPPTVSQQRLPRRPARRFGLLISVSLHVLAAWGAAFYILHVSAPAMVAAGGGDDAGEDGEPVVLPHVAPPARVPHTAMPRVFLDKTPPLAAAGAGAVNLRAPSLMFMPAPPTPAISAVAAAVSSASATKASRSQGKGLAGKGRGRSGAGGPGRNEVAAAMMPAAPTGPRLLHSTAPEYPAGARSRGEHGTVWVKVQVSAGGRVEGASVHRSCGSGDLDAAAVRTARQWTFSPATIGGQAVSAAALVKVNFVIR